MKDANLLSTYPRFIFNCNDGRCLSTGDLNFIKKIKLKGFKGNIIQFIPEQEIEIPWTVENKTELKTYKIESIEIRQIKYDLDEQHYGFNSDDCENIQGQDKTWIMEIYIRLNVVTNTEV
jgi:hypothetical protein